MQLDEETIMRDIDYLQLKKKNIDEKYPLKLNKETNDNNCNLN